MDRRDFLKTAALGSAGLMISRALAADAPDYHFDPTNDIIKAPSDPALWPKFREQLAVWRKQRRAELYYDDALYRRPDFSWTSANYACAFLMLNDERFYDATAGHFQVAEWLEMMQREFGGCDSVVLWHGYPRLGLDDRNQYDFYREQPGGLEGLRVVVAEFRAAGVHSFINYNPWDVHTRREAKSDLDMLCEIVGALEADGIFLDTMKEGAADFRVKLDAVRPGVVLEGEIALPMERIADHHLGWAQGFKDSEAPGVVRNKWFERRHLVHHVQRWGRDRTEFFQAAWMNGTGTMLWDNVFGSWRGYSLREKSILRAMLPIQRRFTALLAGENWTPLVPASGEGIYASLWENAGLRLWTLVNRGEVQMTAVVANVELKPGEQLWDLVAGLPAAAASGMIRARGIGCFLAARPEQLGDDFPPFLERQRMIDQRANWDAAYPSQVRTKLKKVTPMQLFVSPPAEMAPIPGGSDLFDVRFRIRECGWYESDQETIEGWGHLHRFSHFRKDVVLKPFAMDLTPVTNAQFAEFLRASGYQPKERANFLKHWRDGAPSAGQEDHPVVHVDLLDARAYAAHLGKRLPTEEEWQWAAQGSDGRKYPWGNDEPTAEHWNSDGGGTTPVRQFPKGRSPFGLYDLCGNTWEWTESERADGINRFAILRGGSFYQARLSTWSWYMDGGPQEASFGCKYLLQWPGLDRSATVGFRCVADLLPA